MASVERAALEREADRLGVAWSDDMPDGRLRANIDARELGLDLSRFVELPDCFGQFWDKPNEEFCQDCPAEAPCFQIFTRQVARLRANGLGEPEIATELEVSPAAVQLAIEEDPGPPGAQGDPEPIQTPEPSEPIQEAEAPAPIQEPEPSEPIQEPEPEKPAAKKRKKRPPKKKPPPGPEADPRPPMAQSATPAAALGDTASRRASPVKGSADPLTKKPRAPWGQHTWKARREKERERSKWIAMISPGHRLHREYKGRVWTVMVRADSYLLEQTGVAYPTLYAVTKAIVGTKKGANGRELCAWSAVKFWNVKKIVAQLPS